MTWIIKFNRFLLTLIFYTKKENHNLLNTIQLVFSNNFLALFVTIL